MHIAINSSPISTGHSFRGVGSYTKSLVDAFQIYEKDHVYTFFSDKKDIPNTADIIHYPYFDPFFLTLPIHKTIPTVVTCHDLIPLVYPEKFPAGIRGSLKWLIQKNALGKTAHVVTDSFASKNDIARVTGISKKNISVVYSAPSEDLAPVRDKKILDNVKKTHVLPNKFILYVGDVNWNKNILGLLRGFAKVHKNMPELALVLVGKAFVDKNLAETQEINREIQDLHLESATIKTGRVGNDELAALYSLASLYVQPSYAEGFGLPILEAMVCGCPVVSTYTTSLEEITGPAVVTTTDNESIEKGIEKGLALDADRQKEIQEQWVGQFTWQKTASATIRIYEKVLSGL